MADKLTLKLGIKITSPTSNTKVEVIKKEGFYLLLLKQIILLIKK